MSNANHSWDGSQLVGSISGFSDISTGVAAEPQQVNVITPSDLLSRIERMQHFLQLPEVDHLIRVIYDHIDKKGNPHRTTLDQFVNQITDVLYAEYKKNGGDKTEAQYLSSLFKVLHVASAAELTEGVDPTALVSVAGIRQLIHSHEVNPDAHHELMEKMFPGSPVNTEPAFSLIPALGINKQFTQEIPSNDASYPYTYVGKDRYIHVAKNGVLPTDYSYADGCVACFGEKTNHIVDCNDFSIRTLKGIQIDEYDKDPMNTSLASKIKASRDLEMIHSVTIENIELTARESRVFSVYAKAGSCKYFMISFLDYNTQMTVRAIFNIEDGTMILIDHMEMYKANIVKIGHKWFRCELTLLSEVDQVSDIEMTFFKRKDPRLQNFAFEASTNELLGSLFGMQLEEGNIASPFIFSKTQALTRAPIYVTRTLDIDNWDSKSITVNVGFRKNKDNPFLTDRPLVSMYHDDKLVNNIVWRSNSMLEVQYWAELTTSGITITSLIGQTIFEQQSGLYGHVSTSIDANNIINAYDKRVESKVTPTDYSIGNRLVLGTDLQGNFFDGYITSVVVYPCGCSESQLIFLNGDEINGN